MTRSGTVPLRVEMTARVLRAYADAVWGWTGEPENGWVELGALDVPTFRTAAEETAASAAVLSDYLLNPLEGDGAADRLRSLLGEFTQRHKHFGRELRAAVRAAARAGE